MATIDGTRAYRDRHESSFASGYFRSIDDLQVSSIGLGTYLGDPTDAVDARYEAALTTALESGCNAIDTAINYRHQRSERVVARAIDAADTSRDEIFLSTKGGFLAFDGDCPTDPGAYVHGEYVESGIIEPDDVAAGSHCMTPAFLSDQLDRSLSNLRCASVDLYYLHNPETQLRDRPREAVYDAIEEAFVALERQADAGALDRYGIATWDAFRVSAENPSHLSVSEVVERAEAAAERVGAAAPRFAAIQLPFSASMPEAATVESQDVGGERLSALEAIREHNLAVVTSASVAQGSLVRSVPSALAETVPGEAAVERAINFARSPPGAMTALVGTTRSDHVTEDLRAGAHEPIAAETFDDVVKRLR